MKIKIINNEKRKPTICGKSLMIQLILENNCNSTYYIRTLLNFYIFGLTLLYKMPYIFNCQIMQKRVATFRECTVKNYFFYKSS